MSSSTGTNGEPVWASGDAPSIAASFNELSEFALERGGLLRGTTAEREAFSTAGKASEGDHWYDTTLDHLFMFDGSSWKSAGDRTVGFANGGQILATTTDWLDVATFTGTSTGGKCLAEAQFWTMNGTSGLDRQVLHRIMCDTTEISPAQGAIPAQLVPLTGNRPVAGVLWGDSTPAAGSHTWKLQMKADSANAIYSARAFLKVTEGRW